MQARAVQRRRLPCHRGVPHRPPCSRSARSRVSVGPNESRHITTTPFNALNNSFPHHLRGYTSTISRAGAQSTRPLGNAMANPDPVDEERRMKPRTIDGLERVAVSCLMAVLCLLALTKSDINPTRGRLYWTIFITSCGLAINAPLNSLRRLFYLSLPPGITRRPWPICGSRRRLC